MWLTRPLLILLSQVYFNSKVQPTKQIQDWKPGKFPRGDKTLLKAGIPSFWRIRRYRLILCGPLCAHLKFVSRLKQTTPKPAGRRSWSINDMNNGNRPKANMSPIILRIREGVKWDMKMRLFYLIRFTDVGMTRCMCLKPRPWSAGSAQ